MTPFNTAEEYGAAFLVDYDLGTAEINKVIGFAIADAARTLPAGTKFEIRTKPFPKERVSDYGTKTISRREDAQNWGVAWYRNSKTDEYVLFNGLYLRDGYNIIARLRTSE